MLSEMKKYPNWVAYRLEWNEAKGKNDKIPLNPITGAKAKANEPTTWGSYDDAVAAIEKFGANGIGFEFSESPFAGIDLDDCFDNNRNLSDMAEEIVKILNSYTEISPSGNGLHILVKFDGAIEGAKRNDAVGLETYSEGRYFTVTGKVYGELKPVEERTKEVRAIREKFMKKAKPQFNVSDDPTVNFGEIPSDDDKLLQVMFDSKDGAKISELYYGGTAGFVHKDGTSDVSTADLSFCHYLAFYTLCDRTRMDRIFRKSKRYRRKWDEIHDGLGRTYGEITIDKAIASTNDGYTPGYGRSERTQERTREEKQESEKIETHTLADYLQNSLIRDFVSFREYSERKTGFSNLDKDIFIMPGLYLIGAVSGAGKTTFCTQLGDNLASKGELVLFFSFEMSEFELATKGLSRLMYKNAVDYTGRRDWSVNDVLTAVEIRRGKSEEHSDHEVFELIERARAEYSQIAANEIIIQCDFETGMDTVIKTVKEYESRNPIVFIDYLQAISKTDRKQPTREVIDDTVKALRAIARDSHVPVFLISSFNRENYLNVVDLTSFKESGGIEYTADFVAGLQLRAMNAPIFNSDKEKQIKREFIRQEQMKMPRELELVVLKSRFTSPGAKYYFDYYAPYDYFQACGKKRDEIQSEINERAEIFKAKYEENAEKKKVKEKIERR